MKKVVRLNENDIERMVNRIIKEESINENVENKFLSMLVENVIKEEDGEQDDPKDVEKFLQVADKYFFSKYAKYAEKVDTPIEKAKLIAALAKKWGVGVDDLSRVKSVLQQESIKSRRTLNEVNINNTVRKIKARGKAEDYEIERVLDYVKNKVGGSVMGNTLQGDNFTITAGNTGFNVRKGGGRKMMFNYDQIGNMAKFLKESVKKKSLKETINSYELDDYEEAVVREMKKLHTVTMRDEWEIIGSHMEELEKAWEYSIPPSETAKKMVQYFTESRLDEVGGYDDPTIMGQHAGTVIGILTEVVRGIVLGLVGLDQMTTTNKGNIMENVKHLIDAIEEGISLMEKAIKDFTEDELIDETKYLIGRLKRFNRQLRVLETMGHGYGETDFMHQVLDMSNSLTTDLNKYIKHIRKSDEMFTMRLHGRDRGGYGQDYFNN